MDILTADGPQGDENGSSRQMVPSTGQNFISDASTLWAPSSSGLTTPQPPPSDFNFDPSMFGIAAAVTPVPSNSGLPTYSSCAQIQSAQHPVTSSRATIWRCSIPHHAHAAWPREGLIVIQKCERQCQFCQKQLLSASSLRKHVTDHKIKDKLNIRIARSSSGRQRQELFPSNSTDVTISTARFDPRAQGGQPMAIVEDPVPETILVSSNEALRARSPLRQQNEELRAELTALKREMEALKKRDGPRSSCEKQKESNTDALVLRTQELPDLGELRRPIPVRSMDSTPRCSSNDRPVRVKLFVGGMPARHWRLWEVVPFLRCGHEHMLYYRDIWPDINSLETMGCIQFLPEAGATQTHALFNTCIQGVSLLISYLIKQTDYQTLLRSAEVFISR
ncbi:hypothetical protein F4777DRAFT_527867 [Nemania sp. FL0916]|nr:hypothetical protein F4777DRAFT_527867 [Nemania sp. FL0916]